MRFNNAEALKKSLWNIEPREEDEGYIGVCELCDTVLYDSYEYLESDDGDKFCDESCFVDHAFDNYLKKRN